jgi:hypothetical protein
MSTILRADYIQDSLNETAYRRATLPHLHRVVVGEGRDLHAMIVADPFFGFIPGTTAPLGRCRQEAYCLSRNNPTLLVSVETLEGNVVVQYKDGLEVKGG